MLRSREPPSENREEREVLSSGVALLMWKLDLPAGKQQAVGAVLNAVVVAD